MGPAKSGSSTTSSAADRIPDAVRAATRVVPVGPLRIGGGNPLALLAGPCAIQDETHALKTAETLVSIAADAGVPFVYKSSYDKANRSSVRSLPRPRSPRGPPDPPPGARELRVSRPLRRPRASGTCPRQPRSWTSSRFLPSSAARPTSCSPAPRAAGPSTSRRVSSWRRGTCRTWSRSSGAEAARTCSSPSAARASATTTWSSTSAGSA